MFSALIRSAESMPKNECPLLHGFHHQPDALREFFVVRPFDDLEVDYPGVRPRDDLVQHLHLSIVLTKIDVVQ